MVSKPAALTAAAVKLPEIADAIDNPARTSMIIRSITTPNGVLMTSMIEPDIESGNVYLPSQEKDRGS